MISDELLRKAAEEAALDINRSLPAPEECQHDFSPAFERKIRKLIKQVKHPYLYRVMKTAACVALVCSVGFGSVIAGSPTARAAVFGWVRNIYQSIFYEYEFEGQSSDSAATKYKPDWVPQRYHLKEKYTLDIGEDYLYCDSDENSMLFSYSYGTDATSLYVELEGCTQHTAEINGCRADIYLPDDPTKSSVIVWIRNDTMFYINGTMTEDELVRMAESVSISD